VSYSVGQVAGATGVTVRTLHHYDEIGLLSPRERSLSGYRLYMEEDLERLLRILFYRELGFPLEDIAAILNDLEIDSATHLRRQHRMLSQRVGRLQAMVAAVEREMEAQKMGISLTPEERLEVFGDFLDQDYASEAEQKWGDTPQWEQSQQRTKSYSKKDWQQIQAEAAALEQRLAAAMAAGAAPTSKEAMDLADEHRQHITRWYYDCTYPIHRGLGQMYVADERFRARYEGIAPGLAEFLMDASAANADRAAQK
jgi:MerR family transcriptional regulator, thiopeptide resistance regulator